MWGTDGTRFYTEQDGLVLVLRGDRSPSRRSRGLARGQARRSLGGARADSPRRAPRLRAVRQGRGAGLGAPVRLGPAVHRRRVDQRGEVAGVHDLAVVRRRTGVQRGRGALHAHAQGAVHLPASVPRASRRRARSSPNSLPATTPSGSSSGWGIERRRKRVRMPSGGPHERDDQSARRDRGP